MTAEIEAILAYHQASKHNFKAYAPGPRRLDMSIKPDLFLNYHGTRLLNLDIWNDEQIKADIFPAYEQAFSPEKLKPSELNAKSISRLFFDSFAISAWKKAGGTKWPLRVNPSSGNLHPTETYLLSGPVKGLLKSPSVCHYAPLPHALELRAEFSPDTWKLLSSGFPEGTFFVGMTSIFWRVSWKYGLRAFRSQIPDALGVARRDQFTLPLGKCGNALRGDRRRVRKARHRVRVVARPHDVLDADLVAERVEPARPLRR